jgi:hypothetical protein
VLDKGTTHLVVNRLTTLPTVRSSGTALDIAYLGEEWRAILAAWLRTLPCPVLNPPRAASLCGPVLPTPVWRSVARAHGFTCPSWTSGVAANATRPADVWWVGGTAVDPCGAAPSALKIQLGQMARFVGAPLLSARFDRASDWQFVSATAFPSLAECGEPLVDALVALSLDRAGAI